MRCQQAGRTARVRSQLVCKYDASPAVVSQIKLYTRQIYTRLTTLPYYSKEFVTKSCW